MHSKELVLILASFTATINACGGHSNASNPLVIGDDGPADPATLGYTLNHFGLVVNNLSATMNFYGNVLGMRHIFTFQASEAYTVAYMGYSHGGKNGTGFQSGPELLNEKNNIEGLIEFLEFSGGNDTVPASTAFPNTFSHVGFVVPDIAKTQSRMEEYGVTILKRVGEAVSPDNTAVANAYGLNVARRQALAAANGIDMLGFEYFLIVEDPDSNVVEIQPQY